MIVRLDRSKNLCVFALDCVFVPQPALAGMIGVAERTSPFWPR